jgi:hypothetical protein
MIICGSLSPQILIPWVDSLEKEAFKQLLKADMFEDARLKILSSQKRGEFRGVPFEPFRLPTPSLMFF